MSGQSGREFNRRRRGDVDDDDDDGGSKLRNLQAFSRSAQAGATRRVSSRSPQRGKSSSSKPKLAKSSTEEFLAAPPPTTFARASSAGVGADGGGGSSGSGGFQWSTPFAAPSMPTFGRSASSGAPSHGVAGSLSPGSYHSPLGRSPRATKRTSWIDPLLNLVQMPSMDYEDNDDGNEEHNLLNPIQRRVDQKLTTGEAELEAHTMALIQECSDSSNEDGGGGGSSDDIEATGWTTTTVNDRVNDFYDGDVETSDPQLAREIASSILFRADSVRKVTTDYITGKNNNSSNRRGRPNLMALKKHKKNRKLMPSTSSLSFHHSRIPHNHKMDFSGKDENRNTCCFRLFKFVVLLCILLSVGLIIYMLQTESDLDAVMDYICSGLGSSSNDDEGNSSSGNNNHHSDSDNESAIPPQQDLPGSTLSNGAGSAQQAISDTFEGSTEDFVLPVIPDANTGGSTTTVVSDRMALLLHELHASSASLDRSVLQHTTSPQYLALQWIADSDPLQIPINSNTAWEYVLERYALVTFYYSTGGLNDTWENDANWLSSKDICEWHGVSCIVDNELISNRVKGLHMNVNSLEGNLPEELALLSALKTIKVAGNTLTGTVPRKLQTLKDLHTVHLEANRFHGDLNQVFCEENTNFATFHRSFVMLTEVHSDCAAPHYRVNCNCCTGCGV